MDNSVRQSIGGLAFAVALLLVGLLLGGQVEVLGVAFTVAAVVVAISSLVTIARTLGRPAK